jgi:4-diphosphocytidyl-2-C-methyl-D-erythritol kinase
VSRATIVAPAKINLALRILGRRADGYHELDSILLPLGLEDLVEVTVVPATAAEVECRCPEHPELDGPGNLAARATRAYLERAGLPWRVELVVHKRIWTAAGLGGGSSDAGAALRALQQLSTASLAPPQLAELALELGADVPFFLDPRPARAQGIGDHLTPLLLSGPLHLVLVNPGRPLATAAVYAALGLRPGESAARAPLALPQALVDVAPLVVNDLAAAAARLEPAIEPMRQALLLRGARAAGMSGSGATVFGLFDSPRAAAAVAAVLRETTPWLAVATHT